MIVDGAVVDFGTRARTDVGYFEGDLYSFFDLRAPPVMSFCTREAISRVMTRGRRKKGM